jgi:hypothetical protein
MDGRIQEPIAKHIKDKFKVQYVDSITVPGPCRVIAEGVDLDKLQTIKEMLRISIEAHKSGMVFVSGHHDCAANPSDKATQIEQVRKSIQWINTVCPGVLARGLWVDENWQVNAL